MMMDDSSNDTTTTTVGWSSTAPAAAAASHFSNVHRDNSMTMTMSYYPQSMIDDDHRTSMETEDADEIATESTAASTSFDSSDSSSANICPLFMDGLPSNFNRNPQLAALASLLDDDTCEEHPVDGSDNINYDDDDDHVDSDQDDDRLHHQNQFTVLPTIPEERTATKFSASIMITSPKITGIKAYGRHDLILQQRKWQRDQRIMMKIGGGGKSKTKSLNNGTRLVAQKGPRSMMKLPPSKRSSSVRTISSPTKHYYTSPKKTSSPSRALFSSLNRQHKSERMGYGDDKHLCKDGNRTKKKDDSDVSRMAASSSSSKSASSAPSVGETTLFLNLWKL
jgi:hypothetical protein